MANIAFTVLGLRTSWAGFGGRVRMLREYLDTLPSDKIVIFSDADDVLLLPACSSTDILDVFLSHAPHPILFLPEKVK